MLRSILSALAAAFLTATHASAQAAGVHIESAASLSYNDGILDQAKVLKESGKLLSRDRIAALVKTPDAHGALETIPPRTAALPARQIGELARNSYMRIGWYYLCPHCDHWHLNLAGGYVVGKQGAVATCNHCVKPSMELREGYLVAVDADNKVFPVVSIIAANEALDAAIVKIEGSDAPPLPLQDNVGPGDVSYLYSEPFGNRGYFSSGIVNRFYWKKGENGDPTRLKDAERLRLNVSTDWAPGSSGAALLDACGNAIGHVSTISALSNPSADKGRGRTGPALITLHEAVTARGVMLLMKAPSVSVSQETKTASAAPVEE